jgi:nitronate monooxygenase
MAEALRLGAAGVLMGTRFLATPEAPIHPAYKQAIVDATAGATVASPIFDIIWGEDWPGVQARGLQNRLTATWVGREDELRARRAEVLVRLQQAEAAADTQHMILLAGEGAGAIRDVRPAGQVVRDVVAEAARLLARTADGAASA